MTLVGHVELLMESVAKDRKGTWRQQLIIAALVLSDVLVAASVWGVAYWVLDGLLGRDPLADVAVAAVTSSVVAWIGLRAMLGLYPGYGMDRVEKLRRHTYSVIAAMAITGIFAVAFQFQDVLSRPLLAAGYLGILLLGPFSQYLTELCMRKIGIWGKAIIIIGSGQAGAQVMSLMQEKWELGYNPVALFDYRVARPDALPEDAPITGEVLERIADLARGYRANTLVFAMPHTRRDQVAPLVGWASNYFRHVMVVPNLSGITNSAVVARDLSGTFAVEMRHNLLNPWVQAFKRAMDLLGALVGGLLISPLIFAIGILIELDSPGAMFYGHRRLGARGKPFRCWKFRTMHKDADQLLDRHLQDNPHLKAEWEHYQKLRNDPRVTRVGRWLRKTSLDELPQLWNVLRGEMSLVGPRPIVDAEVSKYGVVYELYKRIRPGMSGFWQVSGRSDTSYAERVSMDSYYVRNWSVWLDMVILARTVKTVLSSRGAH